MEPLVVDGSYGEGGGQILRTAVVFSIIQDRPVLVTKVRAGREVPGLRQQHASTLHVLKDIFGGKLSGAEVGSSEVEFSPGGERRESVSLDLKTAASITLLLQAVVPAAAISRSHVLLDLKGGTDVPWSPTFDYLSTVLRPAFELLGISFHAEASRRGYYPRGGGCVRAEVGPSAGVLPFRMIAPVPAKDAPVDLVSRCSNLPRHVAERQLVSMKNVLISAGATIGSESVAQGEADSPGSSVLASVMSETTMMGVDSLGARGKPAEEVGREAGEKMASLIASGGTVDPNLADMISPLLALAGGESELRVQAVTSHLKTGMYVAKLFTGCDYSWTEDGPCYLLRIRPKSGHNA